MTYTPNTWNTGDVVSKAKLDRLEAAAAAALAATDAATVATTGSYTDLANKPTIPATATDVGAQPAGSYATTQALSDGLGTKVNSSTYTAGLAGKVNTPAGGTDGQALVKAGTDVAWATIAGGGTATTDASQLTSGTLPPARIGDGSITAAKVAADVATQAELDTVAASAVQRANHTGTQPASTVTGLATVATSGAYSDLTGKPTIPTAYTDEQVRDVLNATVVGGSGVLVTPSDAGDTLTVAAVNALPGIKAAGGLPPLFARAYHPPTNSFGTYTAGQQVQTRLRHAALADTEDFRLVFVNSFTDSGGITSLGTFTLSCAVENVFGLIRRVTFNGAPSVTMAPGAVVVSDPIGWAIAGPGNANPAWPSATFPYFYTRTLITLDASGGKTPRIEPINTAQGEGCETGTGLTDKTMTGTIGTTGVDPYGPAAIVGVPTSTTKRLPVVLAVGDSITAGTGDTPPAGTPGGYIMRALYSAGIPTVRHGVPSQTAVSVSNMDNAGGSSGLQYSLSLGVGCSSAICEYGFNDMGSIGNQTAVVTANRLILVWIRLAARAGKVFQTTITPNATTTDSYATTTNQTTAAWNGQRTALNDWIRAGAPIDPTTRAYVAVGTAGALLAGQAGHPLTGYFEIADLAESARNSGIWKANYTADGTHPNATGAAALAAGIDVSKLALG